MKAGRVLPCLGLSTSLPQNPHWQVRPRTSIPHGNEGKQKQHFLLNEKALPLTACSGVVRGWQGGRTEASGLLGEGWWG